MRKLRIKVNTLTSVLSVALVKAEQLLPPGTTGTFTFTYVISTDGWMMNG